MRRSSAGKAEDDLHAVLEEAERRKESELSRTGRTASLIIGVPALLFFAWAGVFLLRYHADDGGQVEKPVVAANVEPQTQNPQEAEELKDFLPPALRGGKPARNEPATGPVVNHENISFAMELLNYCRPPSAWKDDGKK